MHGNVPALDALLRAAGVMDEGGERLDGDFTVVSIGDLVDGRMKTQDQDEAILKRADSLVDFIVMGNHEWPFFGGMHFNHYHPAPPVRSMLNGYAMRGALGVTFRVGDTLLTHAGVAREYDFATAEEAQAAVEDAWNNLDVYSINRMTGYQHLREHSFQFGEGDRQYDMPKGQLVAGIPYVRQGQDRPGGVLWSDWNEPKNTNFNQVLGHTPVPEGPALTQYMQGETYTLNIDTGAKGGGVVPAVWLDGETGEIIDFVEVD